MQALGLCLSLLHSCVCRALCAGTGVVSEPTAVVCVQGVETHLMMETSGHGALKENYFLDDGAYLVVKVSKIACEEAAALQ